MDLTEPPLRDLEFAKSYSDQARPFPVPAERTAVVQVVVRQSALNAIHQHGLATTEVEICGVLVGNTYADEQGVFVYVEACIEGAHATSHNAQVTFTAETWAHVQQVLEQEHPTSRILGWYHTHPGFGIFLSGMDRFIHDHFFDAPEQLALVFDPIHREQGLFVWRSGMPVAEPFIIEPDVSNEVVRAKLITGSQEPLSAQSLTAAAAEAGLSVHQLVERVEYLERRVAGMKVTVIFVAIAAIAWPVLVHRWFGMGSSVTPKPVTASKPVPNQTVEDRPARTPSQDSTSPSSRPSDHVPSPGRLNP